jgi:hypothetical protein
MTFIYAYGTSMSSLWPDSSPFSASAHDHICYLTLLEQLAIYFKTPMAHVTSPDRIPWMCTYSFLSGIDGAEVTRAAFNAWPQATTRLCIHTSFVAEARNT